MSDFDNSVMADLDNSKYIEAKGLNEVERKVFERLVLLHDTMAADFELAELAEYKAQKREYKEDYEKKRVELDKLLKTATDATTAAYRMYLEDEKKDEEHEEIEVSEAIYLPVEDDSDFGFDVCG